MMCEQGLGGDAPGLRVRGAPRRRTKSGGVPAVPKVGAAFQAPGHHVVQDDRRIGVEAARHRAG